MNEPQFREVWAETPKGQLMCALINGDQGFLMYLRQSEDVGVISRNPNYIGPEDAEIEYELTNGQRDSYPASWAYPIQVVERALQYFREQHALPPFIVWNNDTHELI